MLLAFSCISLEVDYIWWYGSASLLELNYINKNIVARNFTLTLTERENNHRWFDNSMAELRVCLYALLTLTLPPPQSTKARTPTRVQPTVAGTPSRRKQNQGHTVTRSWTSRPLQTGALIRSVWRMRYASHAPSCLFKLQVQTCTECCKTYISLTFRPCDSNRNRRDRVASEQMLLTVRICSVGQSALQTCISSTCISLLFLVAWPKPIQTSQ